MVTSNIQDHQCNSSSLKPTTSSLSPTTDALENDAQEDQTKIKEVANLTIQIPYFPKEIKVNKSENDPKTPTTMEHRIPVTAACPPAPKKAKRIPPNGERKWPLFPVVQVHADLMVYVDAMLAINEVVYVPDFVVGDLGSGDGAKRLKPLPPPAHKP